jgi:hypothetical protein
MIKRLLQKLFGTKIICAHTNIVSKKVKYCIDCKLVINEN